MSKTVKTNSAGESLESLQPIFENYMTAVAKTHPSWSEAQLQQDADMWHLRNGVEPGEFKLPWPKGKAPKAEDPAPEEAGPTTEPIKPINPPHAGASPTQDMKGDKKTPPPVAEKKAPKEAPEP